MIVKKCFLRDGRIYKFKLAPRSLLVSRGGVQTNYLDLLKFDSNWATKSMQVNQILSKSLIRKAVLHHMSKTWLSGRTMWSMSRKQRRFPNGSFDIYQFMGWGMGTSGVILDGSWKNGSKNFRRVTFLVYWDSMLLVLLWVWGVFNF